jgi:hypothetical protein
VAVVGNVGEQVVRVPLSGAARRELLSASPSCRNAVVVHDNTVELPPGAAVFGGRADG